MNELDKQEQDDLILLSDLATLMFKCKTNPELTFNEIKDELITLYKKS